MRSGRALVLCLVAQAVACSPTIDGMGGDGGGGVVVGPSGGDGGEDGGGTVVGVDHGDGGSEEGGSGPPDLAPPPADLVVLDLAPTGPLCSGSGSFCGGHGVSDGDPGTLYSCPGGGLPPSSSMKCAEGCEAGSPDHCKSAPAGPICRGPVAGAYCGNDMVDNGDANTLYQCPGPGQSPSSSQGCPGGCEVKPQGTNDACRSSSLSCPGKGAYCGQDGVQGGTKDVLYQCPGAGQAPSSMQACSNGCSVQPPGTPDFCSSGSGGGCSALGRAALDWQAAQLAAGNSWSNLCLGFVNRAFAAAGNSPSYLHAATAADSLAQVRNAGRLTGWGGSCPCGAVLYWYASKCNLQSGHAVICNGDGTASTSGWPGYGGSSHASISWLNTQECGQSPAGYVVPP